MTMKRAALVVAMSGLRLTVMGEARVIAQTAKRPAMSSASSSLSSIDRRHDPVVALKVDFFTDAIGPKEDPFLFKPSIIGFWQSAALQYLLSIQPKATGNVLADVTREYDHNMLRAKWPRIGDGNPCGTGCPPNTDPGSRQFTKFVYARTRTPHFPDGVLFLDEEPWFSTQEPRTIFIGRFARQNSSLWFYGELAPFKSKELSEYFVGMVQETILGLAHAHADEMMNE